MAVTPTRWAGCPQPLPLETLSSWLFRVAHFYRMRPAQLLRYGLITEWPDLHLDEIFSFDVYAPPGFLRELSFRSGVAATRLRAMTLARWVIPIMLCQGRSPSENRAFFYRYKRGFEVLPQLQPFRTSWNLPLPWFDFRHLHPGYFHGCTACLQSDEIPYQRLIWQFDLVRTCPLHGLKLVHHSSTSAKDFPRPNIRADQPPVKVTYQPLLHVDWLTGAALKYGRVELPNGRRVGAAWWLRLLCSLDNDIYRTEDYGDRYLKKKFYKEIWLASGGVLPENTDTWEPENARFPAFATHIYGIPALLKLIFEGQVRYVSGYRSRFVLSSTISDMI